MFYAPLILLVVQGAWVFFLVFSAGVTEVGALSLFAVGVSVGIGYMSNLVPARWKDGATIGALGAAYLGTIFLHAGGDLAFDFLFVSVALLNYHLMSFRTTVAGMRNVADMQRGALQDLGSVFIAVVARGTFAAAFVFLISVMIFVVASDLVLEVRADYVGFLLALAVLVALFLAYRREPRTSD